MNWLEVGDTMINLDHVTHIEVSGQDIETALYRVRFYMHSESGAARVTLKLDDEGVDTVRSALYG